MTSVFLPVSLSLSPSSSFQAGPPSPDRFFMCARPPAVISISLGPGHASLDACLDAPFIECDDESRPWLPFWADHSLAHFFLFLLFLLVPPRCSLCPLVFFVTPAISPHWFLIDFVTHFIFHAWVEERRQPSFSQLAPSSHPLRSQTTSWAPRSRAVQAVQRCMQCAAL